MRIAVSSEENKGLESAVGRHFGRCPYFVLVDVDGESLGSVQVLENPFSVEHQPGAVPAFIRQQGAEIMISGGMGRRALGFFEEQGITPMTGATGTVGAALDDYLKGALSSAEPCGHHGEHHGEHPGEHGDHDHGHGCHHGRA